jgi:hypothetical protein
LVFDVESKTAVLQNRNRDGNQELKARVKAVMIGETRRLGIRNQESGWWMTGGGKGKKGPVSA